MIHSSSSIRWKSFERVAPHTIQQLLNDEHFADVTLVTGDDQQIRAHKIILASASLLFQNIFIKNPQNDPLVYLKDINHKFLTMMIEFMYTGQCHVEQQDLVPFFSAGKYLRVIGLLEDNDMKEVDNYLEDNDDVDSEVQKEENIEISYETKCDIGYDIKTENVGIDNTKGVHQENSEFTCNKCDAQYKSISGLWEHEKRVHEGIRYKCNQCEYIANQKINLKRHKQAIHDKVRYKCDQCNHKTARKDKLKDHKASKH